MSKFLTISFIVLIILTIPIEQLFYLKYSLSEDREQGTHLAFAQSSGASSVFVPSNMDKIEIMLNDNQSTNSDSTYVQLITGLSSAGAAILGGIIGSVMTNRSNLKMERIRYEREEDRQKNIQAQQEKRDEDYKERVAASTFSELTRFSVALDTLQDKEFWQGADEKYYIEMMKSTFQTFEIEFLRIPYDIRLTLFSPDVLFRVQNAYVFFEAFRKALLKFIEDYKINTKVSFREAVMNLDPSGIKGIIDDIIAELKSLLPKDIVEKFEVEANDDSN